LNAPFEQKYPALHGKHALVPLNDEPAKNLRA
jgi:hypothetical protein